MRIRHAAMTVTLGIALGGSAWADDIVHFTNGTAMPVRSYKIEKNMIRVDLGNDAVMAFPVSMVEKVETGGRSVFPNSTSPANQAVASTGDSGGTSSFDPNTYQTGHATVPAQYRRNAAVRRGDLDPEEQLARQQQGSSSAGRVAPGVDTAAKRKMKIMAPIPNDDGTYRLGDTTVMDMPRAPSKRGGRGNSQPIATFGPRTDVPASPVADESSGNSDDGSNSDSDPPPER